MAKKKEQNVALYQDYRMTALMEGITPLLMHNPAAMNKGIVDDIVKQKLIPKPEAEALAGAYFCPDGKTLGIPARCFRACLLGGAPNLQIGRRAASTVLKEAIGFFPPEEGDEVFPLEDPDGKPITTYEIDIRRAVVQRSGVMRARPKIRKWRARPVLKLTFAEGTGVDALRRALLAVFTRAGTYPGIVDGRPQGVHGRGLWFGKFVVLGLDIEPIE